MRSTILFFAMLALLFIGIVEAAANEVKTIIQKNSSTEWTVTYNVSSPASRIVFMRNPDDSRVTRWQPHSDKFVIRFEDQQEYIARTDGNSFSAVSINLDPTYTPLPKEYGPFSPFSDGGMVFHSGRFFACAETCDENTNQWDIQLIAIDSDNIIANGTMAKGQAQWQDSDSGQKIYVGPAKPKAGELFVSIIDEQLPETLKSDIDAKLPELVDFFSTELGMLDYRPALYASYSDTQNGAYGRQGGTLPKQIFMHWYGEKSIEQIDSASTYWFFAHEMAHLYQGEGGKINNRSDSWVHEGAAEIFAGLASERAYLSTRISQAEKNCRAGVNGFDNYFSAAAADSRLYYSCGLILMNAIDLDLAANSDKDLFDIWRLFNQAAKQQGEATAKIFVEVLTPHLSVSMKQIIEQFSKGDPGALLGIYQ